MYSVLNCWRGARVHVDAVHVRWPPKRRQHTLELTSALIEHYAEGDREGSLLRRRLLVEAPAVHVCGAVGHGVRHVVRITGT